MGSVKGVSDELSVIADEKKPYIDPADYISSHKDYHDHVFIVGKKEDETETISAVTCYLMSHSSVFRNLPMDDHEVRITDVNPDVFKLILIHVYGGKLPPMDQGTIAQLALAACLYDIRSLVTKASEMIVPKSAEDVFAALVCAANGPYPNLDHHVGRIVRQETEAVLNSDQFLDLDAKCLEYICRQDKLSVTEIELWRALVRWANKKAQSEPEKTKRQHIQTILPYVRLKTFSSEDVGREVIPADILTAEEVMKLITAVTNNHPWELLGICSIREKREYHEGTEDDARNPSPEVVEDETVTKNTLTYDVTEKITKAEDGFKTVSNFTVNTAENQVEVLAFHLESNPIETLGNRPVYSLKCTVTVSKIERGFCKDTFVIEIGGKVIGSSDIGFALKLRNDEPLVLEAQSVYNFALEFNTPHPVYTLTQTPEIPPESPPENPPESAGITVKYYTPLHVKKFCYQI